MRHLKADVSHRMKRRPSIFTARWFRLASGWRRRRRARALARPSGRRVAAQPAEPAGPSSRAARRSADRQPVAGGRGAAARPGPAVRTPPAVGVASGSARAARSKASPDVPAESCGGVARARRRCGARDAGAAMRPRRRPGLRALPDPGRGLPRSSECRPAGRAAAGRGRGRARRRRGRRGREPVPDRRPAARRGDRSAASSSACAGSATARRRRRAACVVGEPVPVRGAIETTRQLREHGVRVRLERVSAQAAGLRTVRVGSYATLDEAERARGELVARGYPAAVVRER